MNKNKFRMAGKVTEMKEDVGIGIRISFEQSKDLHDQHTNQGT